MTAQLLPKTFGAANDGGPSVDRRFASRDVGRECAASAAQYRPGTNSELDPTDRSTLAAWLDALAWEIDRTGFTANEQQLSEVISLLPLHADLSIALSVLADLTAPCNVRNRALARVLRSVNSSSRGH